jgi:hypothetical protein
MCQGVTQFQGDNPNSTDLILSFSVEVDGAWGPYLPCNPRDAKHPEGPWTCDSNIGIPQLPQCKARLAISLCWAACGYRGIHRGVLLPLQAANYSTFGGYCWEGLHSPNGTHIVSGEGESARPPPVSIEDSRVTNRRHDRAVETMSIGSALLEGECCSVAEAHKASHWNYFAQNKSCVLFTVASMPRVSLLVARVPCAAHGCKLRFHARYPDRVRL